MTTIQKTTVLLGALFAISCVTQNRRQSFSDYPPPPYSFFFHINSVLLTVDHVNEDELAGQIKAAAETYLAIYQSPPPNLSAGSPEGRTRQAENLAIDIILTQRSFLENLESRNTIYALCQVSNGEQRVLAREIEFRTGKETLLSAAFQDRLIQRLLKRLLIPQQKRRKQLDLPEDSGL
ncbi:MAG: hypothetical protein LBQ61_01440 [Spirochaetales bacterium]|jgi:hypothetical protein|nr:hypothetical protein [Spirochaetales bacterium]